jgi:hypothetical protein
MLQITVCCLLSRKNGDLWQTSAQKYNTEGRVEGLMIQELKSVDAMYSAKKKRRELNSDERMASYERRLRTRKKGWTSRIISLGECRV